MIKVSCSQCHLSVCFKVCTSLDLWCFDQGNQGLLDLEAELELQGCSSILRCRPKEDKAPLSLRLTTRGAWETPLMVLEGELLSPFAPSSWPAAFSRL